MRKCLGCDAMFEPHPRERNPRKWCSDRCRVGAVHRRERATWTREDRARDSEAKRVRRLQRELGVSAEDYDALLAAQDGVCALCGSAAKRIKLAVDHSHESGEVRGVLCGSCNTALGRLGDTPARFLKVLDYLSNPPARKVLDGR